MSVIIRLQNLPWSANALDVRAYFKGLSIPDGGVHIVGGEMGDAFIAFSTDEDARQAITNYNRGKIKEVQITLLLSSRAEMQKVIEQARQTTLNLMQMTAAPVDFRGLVQQQLPQLQQQQTQPQKTESQTSMPPQPPVISLSGFLAQQTHSTGAHILPNEIPGLNLIGPQSYLTQAAARNIFTTANVNLAPNISQTTAATMEAKDTKSNDDKYRRGRRSRSRSRTPSKDRYRSSRRDRSRSRDRRDRSRSRDRYKSRRDRSRSRDRRDRSRSRDRKDRKVSNQKVSRFSNRSSPTGSNSSNTGNDNKPNIWEVSMPTNAYTTMPPQITNTANIVNPLISSNLPKEYFQNYRASSNIDNVQQKPPPIIQPATIIPQNPQINLPNLNKIQELVNLRNPNAFQTQPQIIHDNQPALTSTSLSVLNNNGGKNDNRFENRFENKYENKFENKFENRFENKYDNRFDNKYDNKYENKFNNKFDNKFENKYDNKYDNKFENKFDNKMASNNEKNDFGDTEDFCVKITGMDLSTGYGDVRRFFQGCGIANNGIKMLNDSNGRRTGSALIKFFRKDFKSNALDKTGQMMRTSTVSVESITDQDYDDGVDSYKPSFSDRYGRNNRNDDRHDSAKRAKFSDDEDDDDRSSSSSDVVEIKQTEPEKPKVEPQLTVIIQDVPSFAKEQDIMKIFSEFTITEVLIIKNHKNQKQFEGYAKFHLLTDAQKAVNDKNNHYIGNVRVYVDFCNQLVYEAAKNEYEPVAMDLEDSRSQDSSVKNIEQEGPKSPEAEEKTLLSVEIPSNENSTQSEPKREKQITEVHIIEDSKSQDSKSQDSKSQDSKSQDSKSQDTNQSSSTTTNEPQKNLPSIFNLIEQFSAIEEQNKQQQISSSDNNNTNNLNNGPPSNEEEACHLANLPYSVKEKDIEDFFKESDLETVDIKLVMRNGRATGEALVLFKNMAAVEMAVKKTNTQLLSRRVFIKHFPKTGLNNLDQSNRYNNNDNNRQNFDRGNNFGGNNFNRGDVRNNMNDRFMNDRRNNHRNFGIMNRNGNNGSSVFNGPMMGMNMPNNNGPMMGMNALNNNGPIGLNGPMRGLNVPNTSAIMGMISSNSNGPMGMNVPNNGPIGLNIPNSGTNAPVDDLGPDDFGPPGCVIAMENISFKATVDDIIEFFPGFDVPHRNVMRRFNDNGQPTGDARVCFNNQKDAQKAFRMRRTSTMMGRPIRMTIM